MIVLLAKCISFPPFLSNFLTHSVQHTTCDCKLFYFIFIYHGHSKSVSLDKGNTGFVLVVAGLKELLHLLYLQSGLV